MLPVIKPGTFVVANRAARQLAFGDVVIANCEGFENIKRVVEVKKDKVHLAGDNHADSHDPGWVAQDQIIARVIWPRV